MRFKFTLVVSSLYWFGSNAATCGSDNCLRALLNASPAVGSAFCASYTAQVIVATTGIPTFLSKCIQQLQRRLQRRYSFDYSFELPYSNCHKHSCCSNHHTTAPTCFDHHTPSLPCFDYHTPSSARFNCYTSASACFNGPVAPNPVTVTLPPPPTSTITVVPSDVTITVPAGPPSTVTETDTVPSDVTITAPPPPPSTSTVTVPAVPITITAPPPPPSTVTVTASIFTCTGPSCPPGSTTCSGNCVNLLADVNNCGTCGHVCSSANGTPTCSSGTCGIICNPGFENCDGNPANGCESFLTADPNNCGACGSTCPFGSESTPTCSSRTCGLLCNHPFANCDSNPINDCEVNLLTSTSNWGNCTTPCPPLPNGLPSCSNAICGMQCSASFGNCDGILANGCGLACPLAANGISICSSASCGVICNSGFANCNGLVGDGCEVNTRTNVNNCGSCGNASSSSNGVASCSGGNCAITCNTGFGNCNNNAIDGCEINLITDPHNCGACGNTCPVAAINCSGGVCVP